MSTKNTIPTRSVHQKNKNDDKPLNFKNLDLPEAERRLVEFCEAQIAKMSEYAKLNNADNVIGFYELNKALSEYQQINLSLIGIEVLAKNELARAVEAFESWYAEKYIAEREILNPRNVSTTKWYATKEIEMHVRTKYKEEYTRLNNERIYAEHKVAMLRRLLDSWEAHQYVLARLSKNIEIEMGGSRFENATL